MTRVSDPYKSVFDAKRLGLVGDLGESLFAGHIGEEIPWSDAERALDTRLTSLKRAVASSPGYYEDPWEAQYLPEVQALVEASDLFTFLQRMPKGGLLHVHPTAMGDYRALLIDAAAYQTNGARFFVNLGVAESNPGATFKLGTPAQAESWDRGYVSLDHAWALYGSMILGVLRVGPKDLARSGDIWEAFQPVFSRVSPLMQPVELLAGYYNRALRYLAEVDNLTHVELRTSWTPANEATPGTKENTILAALTAVRTTHPTFSLRVIFSGTREFEVDGKLALRQIEGDIVAVGEAVRAEPDGYIVGYDLVGEEDIGHVTSYFTGALTNAFDRLNGFLPRFFFHDGESDLPVDLDDTLVPDTTSPAEAYFNNNLIDAFVINTMQVDRGTKAPFVASPARVGHGLELFKVPGLMARYRACGLAVELCPISNQMLRYMKDLREHPGQVLLRAGVPVSLNSDDPAIYGYQGVTHDFWAATIAWNLNLRMLKLLSYNSLRYSALPEAEKTQKITAWRADWLAFVMSFDL